MNKKTNKIIFITLIICLNQFVSAQVTKPESASSGQTSLVVRSDQFSNLQNLLDEQTARGFEVSNVSYRSKLKNLHTKGQLEISLKAVGDSKPKHQYRALVAELSASALEREMNDAGKKGFHLLRQTPIPLDLGFFRSQEMFIALMEKSNESSAIYQYLVIAYRNHLSEKERIGEALKSGFAKVNVSQIGQVTYLTMEK